MLTVRNVTFGYDRSIQPVLNNFSAEFEKGKLYVIVGKSGSGKSTLLSLLAGVNLCNSGSIHFGKNNISEINRDTYRANNIGIIFQEHNLLTYLSAIDNVVLSIEISNKKISNMKEVAYGLLESMGIEKLKVDKKIHKLSGGEQQRVAIASAISQNPDIIIADEPTGSLDEETEQEIMKIFRRLAHEQNKCVIVVTQSRNVAMYSDVLWGLSKGNLNFIK